MNTSSSGSPSSSQDRSDPIDFAKLDGSPQQALRIAELEFDLKAASYALEIADGEIERLRSGLLDVLNPMARLQRLAEARGNRLSGEAYSLAHNLNYVQSIARDILGSEALAKGVKP